MTTRLKPRRLPRPILVPGRYRARGLRLPGYAFRITEGDDTVLFRVDGETRLKALVDAAAWCRAELAK